MVYPANWSKVESGGSNINEHDYPVTFFSADLFSKIPTSAQQVYEEAGEPKEILWLDTTNHIDLYDNEKYVSHAISKITEWFNRYVLA
jgi:hypothetical protein